MTGPAAAMATEPEASNHTGPGKDLRRLSARTCHADRRPLPRLGKRHHPETKAPVRRVRRSGEQLVSAMLSAASRENLHQRTQSSSQGSEATGLPSHSTQSPQVGVCSTRFPVNGHWVWRKPCWACAVWDRIRLMDPAVTAALITAPVAITAAGAAFAAGLVQSTRQAAWLRPTARSARTSPPPR